MTARWRAILCTKLSSFKKLNITYLKIRPMMMHWRTAHHRGPVRCLHHPCQPCRNLGFLHLTIRKPCEAQLIRMIHFRFKDEKKVNIFANIRAA